MGEDRGAAGEVEADLRSDEEEVGLGVEVGRVVAVEAGDVTLDAEKRAEDRDFGGGVPAVHAAGGDGSGGGVVGPKDVGVAAVELDVGRAVGFSRGLCINADGGGRKRGQQECGKELLRHTLGTSIS